MKYEKIWEKVLSEGEKIEYEFSLGKGYMKYKMIMLIIVSILLLPFLGLGILVFLIGFAKIKYQKTANAYALTNKRVLVHRGWLSTNVVSVDYSKITDVLVVEPFLDKIISHTGHLVINTAGTIGAEIVLKHVEKPYEVKKKLDSLKDKHL